MTDYVYPAAPATANLAMTAPSLSFKKQVGKVVASIILFFIVYLLLIVAAIALAFACFIGGVAVFSALPNFLTGILALGMFCLGVSVLIFLVKFVFSVSKDQKGSRVVITKQEQPRLFAFIRQLSTETHTPFPKKIYLSPDVNAAVFYNAGFWSMFLPVRKNLEIGLGLVNAMNLSEFKAVLAHEFGHFSQRSMKLGSFIYNVNRVIYNMLYENRGYTNFLNTWGRIHGFLSLFASLTASIANGIQQILREMYRFINQRYLGLSREMEFHADAVAASVSGSNNMVTALSKLGIAEACFQNAIQHANKWAKENKVTKNIFGNQLAILQSWARENRLELNAGLPEVSYQFIKSNSISRINYTNQWASHPTLEERTTKLEMHAVDAQPETFSAWTLFDQPALVQELLTKNLYNQVQFSENVELCDAQYFEKEYEGVIATYALPPEYLGFYNNRYIDTTGWDLSSIAAIPVDLQFDQLFNSGNAALQPALSRNESDLQLMNAIREKRIDLKTFDFDGIKYPSTQSVPVIEQLENDIAGLKAKQNNLDKQAFAFFLHHAKEKQGNLQLAYLQFGQVSAEYVVYSTAVNRILNIITPFYETRSSFEKITSGIAGIKQVHEPIIRETFKKLMEDGLINDEQLRARITRFMQTDYVYYHDLAFRREELNELRELILDVSAVYNDHKYSVYKKMLADQLAFYIRS